MSDSRAKNTIILLVVLSVLILILAPMFGASFIPVTVLFKDPDSVQSGLLLNLRLPRVLGAFLAGAALAISGTTFQAMFKNALATPYTLGLASGASLGAAVYIHLGIAITIWHFSGMSLGALAGAVLSVSLVYGITKVKKGFSTHTLLLAGVCISFFFSSLILFLHYVTGHAGSFRIVRVLMGSVESCGYNGLINMSLFIVPGIFIIFYLLRELNLLSFGDEIAVARGVDVIRTKKVLFFATSLTTAGVVATCGPIGFIGMTVPHICRLLVGAEHKKLLPASLLFGGSFLVLCDVFGRIVIAPFELPVGIITSLIGGPFFLWLLITGKAE